MKTFWPYLNCVICTFSCQFANFLILYDFPCIFALHYLTTLASSLLTCS